MCSILSCCSTQSRIAGAVEHALDQLRGRKIAAFLLQRFDQFAEGIQRAGDFLAGREFARANHVPKRFPGFLGARFQSGDRCRADSSRRNIQHAQQRDVVLGMKKQPHVGERVAHLGALVKAESAHHAIANAQPPQDFFERPRLRARAIENRHARIGVVAHDRRNLAADEFRFGHRVRRLEKAQPLARAERRLQSLAEAVGVVLHHRGGRIENRLRRAVVFFEANNLRAGKILGEALQVSGARSAPAVNRLILVSDHADVLARAGQQPHQLFLRGDWCPGTRPPSNIGIARSTRARTSA